MRNAEIWKKLHSDARRKMEEEKGVSDWVLWSAFEGVIVVYAYLGVRHQWENPAMVDPGDRLQLVWLFGGLAAAFFVGGWFGGRLIPSMLGRNLLQWGLYNCTAVLGLVLAYLGLPGMYWLAFPVLCTLMMLVSRPREVV